MVLLDTNIFIYLSNNTLDPDALINDAVAYATVTKIEALGYSQIRIQELIVLEVLFNKSKGLALTDEIVRQAVALRQATSMQLGDSIIAASALVHQLEVWTANTKDFKHIEGLKLVNPLELMGEC